MIELYTATTPNGRKVSIALEELGLAYNVRRLDLRALEQKTPAFEAGYAYHMDDFSADAPFCDQVTLSNGTTRPLAILPYALDTNDMKFWLTPALSTRDWLDYACASFDRLYEQDAGQPRMMSLGVHLRIIGRPGRIGAYEAFVAHAKSQPGVWFATRAEIAEAFAAASSPS